MDSELIALQDALVGEYSIEREIGRGGMGIVYLAREVQLNRLVAIKVLPPGLASRGDVRERFLREARTAASLSHPGIVPIHRVGEAAGLPYFVMTYVDGVTLGQRLRERGPMAAGELTRVLRDVGQALAYAHLRGVVHRDVKPDNILLDRESGRALVTDFGIASVVGVAEDSGPVQGTAQFMSPEHVMGGTVDARSDIYALGLVAFVAATGVLPHHDNDVAELMRRRVAENVPWLDTVSPDVPSRLAAAIDGCLERDPEKRFPNAEALVSAVEGPAAPVRPVLPLPLRTWAAQTVPLLPAYGYWSIGNLIAAATSFAGGVSYWGWISLGLAVAPIAPIMVFQLGKTRRALRAGYTLADLRLALGAWRAERLEELEVSGKSDPIWARLLRALAPSGFLTWLIGSVVVSISSFREAITADHSLQYVLTLIQLASMVGLGSVVALTAFGAPIIPPSQQPRWIGRARQWLWNGRVGEWIAARLAPSDRQLAAGDFRPTEMVLSMALGGLFETLPDEYRENLADLPAIVARLTHDAASLRERMHQLASVADIGTPSEQGEVAAQLARAGARMSEVVGTLERIRLGLLRLHGGVTDLRSLTTALDAARLVEADVGRLVDAQSEVSGTRHRLPLEIRTPTPA